jgi:hypothetical protein
MDIEKLKALALATEEGGDIFVMMDKLQAFHCECDPATVLELIAEVERLRADAERFRWLMANKVRMSRADMDGPGCPTLDMCADIWNRRSDLSAQTRITSEIDTAIAKEKA